MREKIEVISPELDESIVVLSSLQKMTDAEKLALKEQIAFTSGLLNAPTPDASELLGRAPLSFGVWLEKNAHHFY